MNVQPATDIAVFAGRRVSINGVRTAYVQTIRHGAEAQHQKAALQGGVWGDCVDEPPRRLPRRGEHVLVALRHRADHPLIFLPVGVATLPSRPPHRQPAGGITSTSRVPPATTPDHTDHRPAKENIVPTDPHRVTAQHIHGLAAADRMRGNNTILADTDDGLRYVTANAVFAEGSTVRRLLLTLGDLHLDAEAAGLSMSKYLDQFASRVAAELNDVLAEEANA